MKLKRATPLLAFLFCLCLSDTRFSLGLELPASHAPMPHPVSPFTCDSFDPVNDPRDVIHILHFVEIETHVPQDVLYAIWYAESDGQRYGYRGAKGGCNAKRQLEIRCELGGDCKQLVALQSLARIFKWDLKKLKGSCGTSTRAKNTGNYGGCLGPMQITPTEWIRDVHTLQKKGLASGGLIRTDPLNLCWSMLGTAHRLARYYEQAKARNSTDEKAWRWTIQRYHGSPGKPLATAYGKRVEKKRARFLQWQQNGEDAVALDDRWFKNRAF